MRHHVMIVDDDPDCLAWVHDVLSTAAHRVTPVRDFATAQRLMRRDTHDLYVIDYHLDKNQNGLELGRQAAELERPFVLITGTNDDTLGDRAMEAGACEFVHKADITPRLLLRVLKNVQIRHRRLRQLRLQTSALTQFALKDSLTGLVNRAGMTGVVHRALEHAHQHDSGIALLYIDLDEFKPINDRHGHAAGDDLLRIVGERLEQAVTRTDRVARIAGDEFLVLLQAPQPFSRQRAMAIGQRILDRIVEPISLKRRASADITARVSASIGAAVFPEHGDSLERLERLADTAMYVAKQAGKNRVVCAPPLRDKKAIRRTNVSDCEIIEFPIPGSKQTG